MKKVLTILVTYNFEPWLHKCIQSLQTSSYPTDILVLDNKSSDNSVAILTQEYPSVRVIANATNLGFGCANNQGLQIALQEGYDFAFLVNQDAWVDKDCLGKLVAAQQPDFGIISPIHMDGTEKALDQGFANYTQGAIHKDGYATVPFINAAFWLIPSTVLKKIGGFSPIFYHYGEDKDYANRINYQQLKTVYVQDALAYHDRQDRPVDQHKFYKNEFVYHLTEYCNINYSWLTAFGKSFAACLKKAFKNTGDRKAIFAYAKIAFKLLGMTGQVCKTRSNNKKRITW